MSVVQNKTTTKTSSEVSEREPDMWFIEYLTPNDAYHHGVQQILAAGRTKYQSMTIADIGPYGRALFLDGKIQTTEGDECFYHEPLVHSAMVANGSPSSVLILGGADGGAAREALRWPCVRRVVVVDIDGEVVKACQQHLPKIANGAFDDPRCDLVIGDALDIIEDVTDLFDVIICDLTDPMENSPSLSLFTREFFVKLSSKLTVQGAVSMQAGPVSLVESPRLFAKICRTLSSVFHTVMPFQIFAPTFGSPLAMALAVSRGYQLPSEAQLDEVFAKLIGELRVLDGKSFLGLFALPRCVRKAIENENEMLTEHRTAGAFGRGIM